MPKTVSRREFMLASALSGAALTLAPKARAAQQPNIILIMADDLGIGDLGCYGQARIPTPNIDRLAADGIRFTQHYAGSPLCAPSRCCLMTGMHTGHARVRDNFGKTPEGEVRVSLAAEDLTVGEVLKSAGYRTGMIGKWGLGDPGTQGLPNRQGFDHFFGFLNQKLAHNHYPATLWRNGEEIVIEGNSGEHGGGRHYANDLFADEAVRFVEAPGSQPFFLYLGFTLPHTDMVAPAEAMAPFRGKFPMVEYEGEDYAQTDVLAAYAAMVSRLDSYVGRLMQTLRKRGLDADTLVLFTSDNGPHNKDGNDPEFFRSASVYRGIKRDLYEGGIRVPLVARWPARIRAGQVSDHVSAFWDFLPTAAGLAGVAPPPRIDGISFAPTLTATGTQRAHEFLYWELQLEQQARQAVRYRNWKGVRIDLDQPIELYDVQADPGETRDLAAVHPDVVREIGALMQRARVDHPLFPLS